MVLHARRLSGRDTSVPNFYISPLVMTASSQTLHGDSAIIIGNFLQDPPHTWPNGVHVSGTGIFVARMLSRDQIAAANVVITSGKFAYDNGVR